MNEETRELLDYLIEIAKRSHFGEVNWTQPNPSTFHWNDSRFMTMIQKASTPRIKLGIGPIVERQEDVDFLFQVTDRTNRQVVVSLSSKERPEFSKVLADIYRGAERGIDVSAGAVLRQLLQK